jgi:hypothetical protein
LARTAASRKGGGAAHDCFGAHLRCTHFVKDAIFVVFAACDTGNPENYKPFKLQEDGVRDRKYVRNIAIEAMRQCWEARRHD